MSEHPSETEQEARVFNPADGSILARYAWMTNEQVDRAFADARLAQAEWAALSVKERASRIRPLEQWFVNQAQDLAASISACNGKPLQDALATEVLPGAGAIRHYCRMAPRWLKAEHPRRSSVAYLNKHTRIHYQPHGLVGIIAPWNYPLGIPAHEVVAALLAGNAVVFKTAPETVPVGDALARGLGELDIPDGLFHHLILPGPIAGERFMANPGGVDKLCFTGSVPVGRLLARKAAETFTPVSLELGGKDAMLVCGDAPLQRSVNGALWGSLQNGGQACAGIERIYVEASLYEDFVATLAERVSKLRVGLPTSPDTDIGPMTSQRQRDRVADQVDAAVADGARIAARSPLPDDLPPGGFYYPPTLLTEVTDDMAVMREETFGPVLAVRKVRDMQEAIQLANASPFGLTASIWTRRRRRGRRLALQLIAGTVTVNDHLMTHGMPEISWGGPRQSGLGRTHGRSGLMGMVREQNVVDERLWFARRAPWWFPYSTRSARGLEGALHAFHGRGAGLRLSGIGRFLRLIPGLFRSQGS
ncbi:aldehyde dehydrogenase family protein [Natronospira bacteriovora]|uniref:Aldehyde dehydrogenase family protein n=1 Tax=Natronospira bacteriovora TaxID=3069753 RepID=A0ABU0W3A8_9GAMM|nr:aldehyde dehydrogenase family protein [Natronospira sp. AB-CW4]MDQ2068408.1 aldehyde dehydrogenase family protein [Natronospira sp. AB-CW4]